MILRDSRIHHSNQACVFKVYGQIQKVMKEVYYKGKPYAYKMIDLKGKRQYQLFENGSMVYSVDENELDIKSVVSLILDSYYKAVKPSLRSSVLS
jgi:hypothetical protein